jgi:preprotein translocase subunit SecY
MAYQNNSFQNFDQSNVRDLVNRILFTLAILVVYRIGVHIPLPGVRSGVVLELVQRSGSGFFGMMDMFSGGAVSNMSIMAMGLMPYISSSIIVQLVVSSSPHLSSLRKDSGEVGQRKISQYTRYGAVLIGAIQSLAIAKGLESLSSSSGISAVSDPGMFFRFVSVLSLTCGTLFLMWLGDRISFRGIGNGSSIIIYSGIIANLPQSALRTLELGRMGLISTVIILFIIALLVGLICFVVFFERSYRKIPVHYARSSYSVKQSVMNASYMPMKIKRSWCYSSDICKCYAFITSSHCPIIFLHLILLY